MIDRGWKPAAGLALALMLAVAGTLAAHARGGMLDAPLHGAGGSAAPIQIVICADGVQIEVTLDADGMAHDAPAGMHVHCLDCVLCFAAYPEPDAFRPQPDARGARLRPHAPRRRVLRRLNPRRARDPPTMGDPETPSH